MLGGGGGGQKLPGGYLICSASLRKETGSLLVIEARMACHADSSISGSNFRDGRREIIAVTSMSAAEVGRDKSESNIPYS
jgi:hypothetical protein